MADVKYFGSCPLGDVHLITISDCSGMTAELITLGAAIQALTLPNKSCRPTDVCLGYDTAEEYWKNDAYFGAVIGRCANRIGGAEFSMGGRRYQLSANEGKNHLHGGISGFDQKLWSFEADEKSAVFTLLSPDMDEGYPGNLRVLVTYSFVAPKRLRISYKAECDEDTLVNLTNHSYFNLAGHSAEALDGHYLTVNAQYLTPSRIDGIPTGGISHVDGTAFDLRTPVELSCRIVSSELSDTRGFDHNFVIDGDGSPAASLYCAKTGITMDVYTNMPGIQVYTAGFLKTHTGKGGAVYRPNSAVCLETQYFPDAANHQSFPSPILKAGELYSHNTLYCFS